MTSLDHFLEHHVNRLVDRCVTGGADVLPVDICGMAKLSGVLSIEKRRMIPEAVLSPEPSGFRIYLQSNFENFPGAIMRQRFSLAHEITHTFFYEVRQGMWRSIRGAPRGEALEAACHQGAGLLLVPQRFLSRELRLSGGQIGAKQAIYLSGKFEVSTEVMVRRLNEVGAFESTDTALVIVRQSPGRGEMIEYATYPPWLKAVLPTPHRGTNFVSWLGHAPTLRKSGAAFAEPIESSAQRETSSGILRVDSFVVTRSQRIFELRI